MSPQKSVSSSPILVTDIGTELMDQTEMVSDATVINSDHDLNKKNMAMLSFFYALENGLSGLNLSYSVIKYFFDMIYSTSDVSSSKLMKAWIMTPAGVAETVSLFAFTMLASQAQIDDKNVLKRYLATVWPHFRLVFKDLKKGNKIVSGTIDFITLLGANGQDLKQLLVPFGLLLGGITIFNHYWHDHLLAKRKTMSEASTQLLVDLSRGTQGFDRNDMQDRFTELQAEYERLKGYSLLSGIYDSLIDSAILYLRSLSVLGPSPIALCVMALVCMVYFVAGLTTYLYDDYRFQNKQLIKLNNIEISLYREEMAQLQSSLLSSPVANNAVDIRQHIEVLAQKITKLESKQEALGKSLPSGTLFSFAPKIKYVLDVFDMHTSILFTAASLLPAFAFSILTQIYVMAATSYVLLYLVESVKSLVCKDNTNEANPEKTFAGSTFQSYEVLPTIVQSFLSSFKKGAKTGSFILSPLSSDDSSPVMTTLLFAGSLVNASVSTLFSYVKATTKKESTESASTTDVVAVSTPKSGPDFQKEKPKYQPGFFSRRTAVASTTINERISFGSCSDSWN